jgi:hypothetical protein
MRERHLGKSDAFLDGPGEPASAFDEGVLEEMRTVWTGHAGRRNGLLKGPETRCVGGTVIRHFSAPGSTMDGRSEERRSFRLRDATGEGGAGRDQVYGSSAEPCYRPRVWTAGSMDEWRQNTSSPPCVHKSVPHRALRNWCHLCVLPTDCSRAETRKGGAGEGRRWTQPAPPPR